MEIFYAVCAGLITAALVWAALNAVATLKQVRATARAIETLAINANEKVEATRGLFDAVGLVSDSVRSFWFKTAQFAASFVAGLRRDC